MIEFFISGVFGIFLISACSLNIYEILRGTWKMLPKINWPPRVRVSMVVSAIFAGHIINIWFFGLVYYVILNYNLGHFVGNTIEQGKYNLDIFGCIYISSLLYTTVGAGDITPEGSLRMIVGVEALTGFMLIGWTITFAYIAMEQFWKLPHKRRKRN
jgi:hypothetical protein